eukprot:3192934-Karenia_brevis.AAC.1
MKKFARDYFHLLEGCFQAHGIDVKNGITSLLPRAATAQFEHRYTVGKKDEIMVQGTLHKIVDGMEGQF